MRSTGRAPLPNMRGRKTMTLRCRCCEAIDLRDKYAGRLAQEEVEEARVAQQAEQRSRKAKVVGS